MLITFFICVIYTKLPCAITNPTIQWKSPFSADTYFPIFRYILKSDDDVFINPRALKHFLQYRQSSKKDRKLLLCRVNRLMPVIRFESKWRVTTDEYAESFYPTYCQGWIALYSPDVVFQLYKESQSANKYFWVDDVFVTGKTSNAR